MNEIENLGQNIFMDENSMHEHFGGKTFIFTHANFIFMYDMDH